MGVGAKVYIERVCKPEDHEPFSVNIAKVECGDANHDGKVMDLIDEFFNMGLGYDINVDGKYTKVDKYGGIMSVCSSNRGLREYIGLEFPQCHPWTMVASIMDCIPSHELDDVDVILYLY